MANNIKAGMKKTSVILLISNAITGLAIAWIDARPNWDDTGIASTQNWGSLLAFIPGFAGAYLGFNLIRKFK